MAKAVELGFSVNTIDELRTKGVTDQEIGNLIIKPRTLSHRRARRSRLTTEESDRAARLARVMALAGKDVRQQGQGRPVAPQGAEPPERPAADRPDPYARRCPGRRGPADEHRLGRRRLMQLWRLSGADYAERLDGGYGLALDGRWNGRGRPVTYCSTGPALCVLEKLVHIDDAALLPDEMMLVRYDAPDALNVEEVPLDSLPDRWRMSRSLTMGDGQHLAGRCLGVASAGPFRHRAGCRHRRQKRPDQPSPRRRGQHRSLPDRAVQIRSETVRARMTWPFARLHSRSGTHLLRSAVRP